MLMKKIVVVASCMIVSVAVGWFAHSFTSASTDKPADARKGVRAGRVIEKKLAVRDETADLEIAALKKRIKELESLLFQEQKTTEDTVEKAVESAVNKVANDRREPRDFRARMEQMKKDDPLRYEEMRKNREEWRNRMRQREQEKVDFLSSVDTSGFSPAAKATHEQLLGQIEKVNALVEEFREQHESGAFGNLTDEQRREQHESFRQEMELLQNLYQDERNNLLLSTAESAGFTGTDANDFVQLIQGIYDSTSAWGPGRRGGRGGPGGPPPPPR